MSDSHPAPAPAHDGHAKDDKPAAAEAAKTSKESAAPASKYSSDEWVKKLQDHFQVPAVALSSGVKEKISELNKVSKLKMLKRKGELADAITKHKLFDHTSDVARELPPGWHELSNIRTTHKFVKIEANGDLTFKKATRWTKVQHKLRKVFAFFGARPVMEI